MKQVYDKFTTNTTFNEEKLKDFKDRKKTRVPTLNTLFNIVLEVLARAIKQEKK